MPVTFTVDDILPDASPRARGRGRRVDPASGALDPLVELGLGAPPAQATAPSGPFAPPEIASQDVSTQLGMLPPGATGPSMHELASKRRNGPSARARTSPVSSPGGRSTTFATSDIAGDLGLDAAGTVSFSADDILAEGEQANDLPVQPRTTAPVAAGESLTDKAGNFVMGAARNVRDFAVGAGKGLGHSALGAGKLMTKILPGVEAAGMLSQRLLAPDVEPLSVVGLLDAADAEFTTPKNTAERLGRATEQVGEFIALPAGAGKLAAKVATQGAGSGVLAAVQGGGKGEVVASAALGAAGPVAGKALAKAPRALRASAEKNVTQALGPTKEWAKDIARRIAPDMVDRGVKGSREAMLDTARSKTKEVGQAIGAASDAAAAAGQSVEALPVVMALLDAKKGLMTVTNGGKTVPIEGAKPVVQAIDRLEKFVLDLGPDIPMDRALAVRRTWDRIIAKAGLYGPKVTANATDNAKAWAMREATSALRKELDAVNPTIAGLNDEYAFWVGLRNVLAETERRTASHGAGLASTATGGAGVVAGLASGDDAGDKMEKALLYGVAGRQLVKGMQSPWFRTEAAAPLKNALSSALAKGNPERVARIASKIASASAGGSALRRPAPATP